MTSAIGKLWNCTQKPLYILGGFSLTVYFSHVSCKYGQNVTCMMLLQKGCVSFNEFKQKHHGLSFMREIYVDMHKKMH